ncbi:glycoside hydrolase family 43 protein [Actinotalea sp. M2MS4P-6]|uniref:glycoside hydrolase family 43 protein n=1 Tax=Actinotalea sp. M2MS4P-6 TaxID=2983762 RepID=UPI0021E40A19|nr:glycoside hydrolase family 43 protein [Actinotalea sp. M2MS4P-6]MCV2394314.1 glycoside hydrolase family 43 protein [Actinotalea sp. M2MS4P-6]
MMPAYAGYFADPFVLRLADGTYVAFGTDPTAPPDGAVFECLTSPDLVRWTSHGAVLERLDDVYYDEYWAPEIAPAAGRWWMYYSTGHGIEGHHLRVAVADAPTGPYRDVGANLTPLERFAIDPHPFTDVDGTRYLFYARDVLDSARPGTHLAVARLASPTQLGPATEVLAPTADWQLYQRSREMYGRRLDWYTLEGPTVVHRRGAYWLTYSGGAWTGERYAVSWARAEHPLGPWEPAADGERLLASDGDLIGPGHNSITVGPEGSDVIAFHAWDHAGAKRQMHLRRIEVSDSGPQLV